MGRNRSQIGMAARTYQIIKRELDILAHIIAYLFIAALILSGLGLIVAIAQFFYYRKWRSNKVKVYYDDNDHRKGYYIVNRPRGPYPVGYPKEKIIKDMEAFERLKREQKEKAKNHNRARTIDKGKYYFIEKSNESNPTWIQILMMTPAEYMAYRRRKKERKKERKEKKAD